MHLSVNREAHKIEQEGREWRSKAKGESSLQTEQSADKKKYRVPIRRLLCTIVFFIRGRFGLQWGLTLREKKSEIKIRVGRGGKKEKIRGKIIRKEEIRSY